MEKMLNFKGFKEKTLNLFLYFLKCTSFVNFWKNIV